MFAVKVMPFANADASASDPASPDPNLIPTAALDALKLEIQDVFQPPPSD